MPTWSHQRSAKQKQVVLIAAKTQTSVDNSVVPQGNTVLGHTSLRKQTQALCMSGTHKSVASADAAALAWCGDVVVFPCTTDKQGCKLVRTTCTVGSGGRAVERRTVNRGDSGSIPPTAISKLRQFRSPHICLCLSEETLKAGGHFYLVSMPGEVKDPTQGVNV